MTDKQINNEKLGRYIDDKGELTVDRDNVEKILNCFLK